MLIAYDMQLIFNKYFKCFFFTILIIVSIDRNKARLRPFKSHTCEVMLARFLDSFHLKVFKKNRPISLDFMNLFKNTKLISEIERNHFHQNDRSRTFLTKYQKSDFHITELAADSNSSKDLKLKVLQQINGIAETDSSKYKIQNVTLVDEELRDFTYNFSVAMNKFSVMPRIASLGEGVMTGIGTAVLLNSLYLFANHALPTDIGVFGAMSIAAIHQMANLFSYYKQILFDRDYKIISLMKDYYKDIFAIEEMGYWNYRSFHYEMLESVYENIVKGNPRDLPSMIGESSERSSALNKLQLKVGAKGGINSRYKKIYVTFDFLYYFDPTIEKRTLTITVRANDNKPSIKHRERDPIVIEGRDIYVPPQDGLIPQPIAPDN